MAKKKGKPGNKKGWKKPTGVVAAQRRSRVEEWLRDGLTRADIIKNTTEGYSLAGVKYEGWGITENGVDWYIGQVKKSWKDMAKADSHFHFEEANQVRLRLYLRALQRNDIRTALAIRDSLDKIRGIFIERNLNLNADAQKDFELSPAEEERLSRELGIIFPTPGKDQKK